MKKSIVFAVVMFTLFAFCACSPKLSAEEAGKWTKAEWTSASDEEKTAALASVIKADRDDVDAKKSAEISIEGFDEYFDSIEDESVTLKDVYDLCRVEEVK